MKKDSSEHADVLALEVSCPRCDAKQAYPCVYTAPRTVPRTPSSEYLFRRVGQPMKTVHRERSAKATEMRRRRGVAAYRSRPLPTPSASVLAAIKTRRAQQEYDRREQRALIAWLMHHASILTG